MKELIRNKFAALILVTMLADVVAAIIGASEVFVVIILCVCIVLAIILCACKVLAIIHDILGRKQESQQEEEEPSDLDGFFKKGGVAYRWNKGDKDKEKCYSMDTLFDGKKTDYVELWLGNKRYFIKDMKEGIGNETDSFLHKSEKEDEKFFDNLSNDRLI